MYAINSFKLYLALILFFYSANYTYAKRGTKAVNSITTGQEKTKISCAFCASAVVKKLPILILVPRKTPLKDFTHPENVLSLKVEVTKPLIKIGSKIVSSKESSVLKF